MPRFLSPGDTISVPVTISLNTTGKNADAAASTKTTGPVKVLGATQQQSASVNSNSESRSIFTVVASNAVDTGRIYINVQALGEKFTETVMGVWPASPLQLITGSGS